MAAATIKSGFGSRNAWHVVKRTAQQGRLNIPSIGEMEKN